MSFLDPNSPEDLDSIKKCREITKEILNFGVSEKEITKIIELLSYELENISLMKHIKNFYVSESQQSDKKNIIL